MQTKVTFAIAISIAFISCGTPSQPSQHALPAPELHVATAAERVISNRIEFITQTKPVRSYVIQSRVNGYLRSVEFSSGMPVKRGTKLYTIDTAPFQTQVVQARAALASAKANLVETQSNYDRNLPLSRINAISHSQLDAATASLASAREQVASAQAVLDDALINLGYCTIYAPERGVIAPSTANVGDYVGAGTAYASLTTISFDDSVSVDLSLPMSEYYPIATTGGPIYQSDSLLHDIVLTLADGSVYPYRGTYNYTEPLVDNQSGSVVFNVQFPNAEGRLKGGQFARVTASVGPDRNRVLIPARAVSEIQGTFNAFVVAPGDSLQFRTLTLGPTIGSEWVVLSGIAKGERVITDGLQKAKSGMKIKPIEQ